MQPSSNAAIKVRITFPPILFPLSPFAIKLRQISLFVPGGSVLVLRAFLLFLSLSSLLVHAFPLFYFLLRALLMTAFDGRTSFRVEKKADRKKRPDISFPLCRRLLLLFERQNSDFQVKRETSIKKQQFIGFCCTEKFHCQDI